MKVTKDVVRQIAELAQLQISDDEVEAVTGSMTRILDLVEEMQSVDTDGVEPMAHPLDTRQTLRPDVVSEDDQRDYFQENAPEVQDGLYLVPRVVE